LTQKKEKTPDIKADDPLWKTFSLNTCAATSSVDFEGLTFNMDLSGGVTSETYQPDKDDKIIQLLTDIWHNQATIIKWLSKIAENTKSK